MKIVLRTVLGRFALASIGAPETTRRRGITFSPSGGATVVLTERSGRTAVAGGNTAVHGLPAPTATV
jgi:hypothetical protein